MENENVSYSKWLKEGIHHLPVNIEFYTIMKSNTTQMLPISVQKTY